MQILLIDWLATAGTASTVVTRCTVIFTLWQREEEFYATAVATANGHLNIPLSPSWKDEIYLIHPLSSIHKFN